MRNYLPQAKKNRKRNPPSRQKRREQRKAEIEQPRFPAITTKLVPYLHPEKLCEYIEYFLSIPKEERVKQKKTADEGGLRAFVESWNETKKMEPWQKGNEKEKRDVVHTFLKATDLVVKCTDDGTAYLITKSGFAIGVDCMYFFTRIKDGSEHHTA